MSKQDFNYIEKNILPFVEKPSRYIGVEFKNYLKDEVNTQVKICLAFPDIYEIGMSYLGIKLLFHYLNNFEDILVDLVFMPKDDYAEALKQNNFTLHSLAYKIPLKDFDILGFSLNYELCYTNVLAMLDYADIPIHSDKRNEDMPIVIAGGCSATNPAPMQKFIDAFVIGEGEEVLVEICRAIQKNRNKSLEKIAKIKGIYVPKFFDGNKIQSRFIENLDASFFPTDIVNPFVNIVQDHSSIEIQRGCFRSCKFCHASFTNRPVRIRSLEKIKDLIQKTIENSGATDISLLSLSVVDHPQIVEILTWFVDNYYQKNCSVSLPSLRCDKFSIDIANLVNKNKKSSLTFAPEAGSQRLRDVIGKNITEEDIFEAIRGAYQSGWKLVKLYFMYGLPTETDEDIDAIIDLVYRLKKEFKQLRFNVGISAFVPKPHTPFAWEKQEDIESLMQKKLKIINGLKKIAQIKHSKIEMSVIEGLFARGEEIVGDIIEEAYKSGAKSDQWEEHFDYSVWKNAGEKLGIDIAKYVCRDFSSAKNDAWEIIDCGIEKNVLKRMAEKIISSKKYQEKIICREKPQLVFKEKPKEKFKYRIKYEKSYELRFLSHLEVFELLKKLFVRSGLPVVFSEGFHPLPKISCSTPLSVGFVGEEEWVDLELYEDLDIKIVKDKLSQDFLKIKEVRKVDLNVPSLEKSFKIIEYEILFDKDWDANKLKEFTNSKNLVYKIEISEPKKLKIILNLNQMYVKLYPILKEIFAIEEDEFKKMIVVRKKFWLGNGFGPLVEI